jgi:hypothetical protein
MCILPWYWMGFATKIIQIECYDSLNDQMMNFWEDFYNLVLLEFKYVNQRYDRIIVRSNQIKSPSRVECLTPIKKMSSNEILCPLGGERNVI